MYVVRWKFEDHRFMTYRDADQYIMTLTRRGYRLSYKWRSVAGITYFEIL